MRRKHHLLVCVVVAGALAAAITNAPAAYILRDTNELLLRAMRAGDGAGGAPGGAPGGDGGEADGGGRQEGGGGREEGGWDPGAWPEAPLSGDEPWAGPLREMLGATTLAELGVPEFPADDRERLPGTNPCWRLRRSYPRDPARCMPAFYVLGHWQTGGSDLGARLRSHEGVSVVKAPHFWNTHVQQPLEHYFPLWDDLRNGTIAGDTSPGYLATSFSESERFHRAYQEIAVSCWRDCHRVSQAYDVAPFVSWSMEEDDKRRRSATASPRRRCIDGVEGDEESPGCIAKARRADPTEDNGGAFLSLPHLMRAAYGASPPKFVIILREPGARLHDSFWYDGYAHYRSKYGADEAGFERYALEMVRHFRDCVALTGSARKCANRFEVSARECADTALPPPATTASIRASTRTHSLARSLARSLAHSLARSPRVVRARVPTGVLPRRPAHQEPLRRLPRGA